jgi:SAM-dependent methyltransferase
MRICPVCNGNSWDELPSISGDTCMTGDQRIISGKLEKLCCMGCGLVANSRELSPIELDRLYGVDYQLNTLGGEEHFYITKEGKISRSNAFYNWIRPFVPESVSSLLEVGCGEGNVLSHFKENDSYILSGIDGSVQACQLASDKGLDVRNQLVTANSSLGKYDFIYSINVLEHVEDLNGFITTLKASLNKGGKILFCLPIQDYGGYDVFFMEHVWHFNISHIEAVLQRNGLRVISKVVDHPIHHGIGLFYCEPTIHTKSLPIFYTASISENYLKWLDRFQRINDLLANTTNSELVVFGAGEVSTLLLTFTRLSEFKILAFIDDTKLDGFVKHGIPCYNSEWLNSNSVDAIFLAVNPKYYEIIEEKLKKIQDFKIFRAF